MFSGFIKGFGLRRGGLCLQRSLGLVGYNSCRGEERGVVAGFVNRIISLHGGTVVYSESEIPAELPRPVAECISDPPAKVVNRKSEEILQRPTDLGAFLPDANLTLTALTTAVLPFLCIYESGLMDIGKGELVGLII